MSMFFFRLHNLQREQSNQKVNQNYRRGARVFHRPSNTNLNHLTTPSRLFEKSNLMPHDSMDEFDRVALEIPRLDTLISTVTNLHLSNIINLIIKFGWSNSFLLRRLLKILMKMRDERKRMSEHVECCRRL